MKNAIRKIFVSLCVSLFLVSCADGFSKIKVGQTKQEVLDMVGKPIKIKDDFFVKVWEYKSYIVVFDSDTVTKVQSIKEMKLETIKMNEEIERLKR